MRRKTWMQRHWKKLATFITIMAYVLIVFASGFFIGQAIFYIALIGTLILKVVLYLKDRFF